MNIFFCITIIIMFVCQMLFFKKDEKLSIIKWINLNIVLLMAYNLFFSILMSFISIKVTLVNLSILNIIFILILSFKIFQDKKIQKYYIDKVDILATILIFIIVGIIGIKQFGPLMDKIQYTVSDSSIHYLASEIFYEKSEILYKENLDRVYLKGIEFLAPGEYVNTGLLFKVFDGIVDQSYFYIIYNIFNLFNLYLAGMLMYGLLRKDKNQSKILALIFSIIYMLGYPLNSMLSGFAYLSLGLNFIIGILTIYKEDLSKYYKTFLLFLLDFGIIFTYYYFAPMVYLSIFIQILLENKPKKEKILKILYELVIPGIAAVVYFIILQYLKNGNEPVSEYSNLIAMPGPIHKNIITNILIFIVLSIVYIVKCIKDKKSNLESTMELTTITFLIMLFVGSYFNLVSEYYNYKLYNLLWICVISVGYEGLESLKIKKVLVYSIISIYFVGIMCAGIFNQKLVFFDIYRENFHDINEEVRTITKGEMELLQYYNKNINNRKDNTMFLGTTYMGKQIWLLAITNNMFNYIDVAYNEKMSDLSQFIESDRKYMVIFKDDYGTEIDADFDADFNEIDSKIDSEIEKYNLKILKKNEAGMILEKN